MTLALQIVGLIVLLTIGAYFAHGIYLQWIARKAATVMFSEWADMADYDETSTDMLVESNK